MSKLIDVTDTGSFASACCNGVKHIAEAPGNARTAVMARLACMQPSLPDVQLGGSGTSSIPYAQSGSGLKI